MHYQKITPNLNRINLEAHVKIKHIYAENKQCKFQYEPKKFNQKLIEKLQNCDPVLVIRTAKNEYKFFSGWHLLSVCYENDIQHIRMHVYPELKGVPHP